MSTSTTYWVERVLGGDIYEITREETSCGRDKNCKIIIHDLHCSRLQAKLYLDSDGHMFVARLGANSVRVIRGGEELTVSKEEPFEIRNGDFVVFPQEHKFKVIIKNQERQRRILKIEEESEGSDKEEDKINSIEERKILNQKCEVEVQMQSNQHFLDYEEEESDENKEEEEENEDEENGDDDDDIEELSYSTGDDPFSSGSYEISSESDDIFIPLEKTKTENDVNKRCSSQEPDSDIEVGSRKTKKPRTKAISEPTEDEIQNFAENQLLDKLTIPILKKFLVSKGIKPKTLKRELIEQVEDFYI